MMEWMNRFFFFFPGIIIDYGNIEMEIFSSHLTTCRCPMDRLTFREIKAIAIIQWLQGFNEK